MKFKMQLRGTRCARRARCRKELHFSKRMRYEFVEISIRHNGFHVGSFRFASSRYIRFALPKDRLTGSNPMRENRYFPYRQLFLREFFPARRSAYQSPRGGKISRGKSGGREPMRTTGSRTTSIEHPMSLVPVKALHVSILSCISSLSDTHHQILSYSTRIYIHVSRVNDNDVTTTNFRLIRDNSDIYSDICKFSVKISIFHPVKEQHSSP